MSGPPQIALCLADPEAFESVARVVTAASSGLEVRWGSELLPLLEPIPRGSLLLLIIDGALLVSSLDLLLEAQPSAKVLVIADSIDDALLAAALRFPGIVGFVARVEGMMRAWELSYLVRRVVAPQQAIPSSNEILNWGASSVTFRPRTTRDRDQAVQAVEVVTTRFGMSRRAAALAADASHELLMNAMYDAPVDLQGRARYAANRQAAITLAEHEIPTLRVTVDGAHLALDVSDPFGRLQRAKLYGGVLRGRTGAVATSAASVLDVSHGGAGLGLFKLFSTAAILRVEVVPGRQTVVTWMLDRQLGARQRLTAQSLYYLEGRG